MSVSESLHPVRRLPQPRALLTLIKPITWFPPVWAFLCGSVASGAALTAHWQLVVLGMILSGPVVCGMSQAANDWCDRHVDAINEPHRPIPSGQVPGHWGLWVAILMSALALCIGLLLGPWGFAATVFGVLSAWAYSAEPLRLKKSGIWGPGLVGLCYEGLPWFTGAVVVGGGFPAWEVVLIGALYALGAHGIMTLNDFKALKGDLQTGIRSLPAVLGPEKAARVACVTMLIPQLVVIAALALWGSWIHAGAISALVLGQIVAMRTLLQDPKAKAPWYNGTGVLLYVSGMMIAAFALNSLGGAS